MVNPFRASLSLLIAIASVVDTSQLVTGQDESSGSDRPNIVLITVDDMSQDSVGVYGCTTENITPHIDQLAQEGMRFTHAHVTIAVCQPCRAVWMTGLYPHRNGALGFQRIHEGIPTLPETLRSAGYFTAILGKTIHVLPSRQQAWEFKRTQQQLGLGRDPGKYYESTCQALRAGQSDGRPVLLMANAHDPHRPFAGSQQEARRWRERIENQGQAAPTSHVYSGDEIEVPGFLPDLPAVRKEMAEYYTSVHRSDEVVGSVLQAVDDCGMRENTVVFFMSDHGMPLPFCKTNCYFHSTRTPWIVRWPGKVEPSASDDNHMISGIDLTPTILEICGAKPFEESDGRSMVPLLRGERQSGRDFVVTQFHRTSGRNEYPMRSLVTRDYGYIFNAWHDGETIFRNESQSGLTMDAMKRAARTNDEIARRVELFLKRVPEELYDYREDRDALNNLVDSPNHQSELNELRGLLLKEMEKVGDPLAETFQEFLSEK